MENGTGEYRACIIRGDAPLPSTLAFRPSLAYVTAMISPSQQVTPLAAGRIPPVIPLALILTLTGIAWGVTLLIFAGLALVNLRRQVSSGGGSGRPASPTG